MLRNSQTKLQSEHWCPKFMGDMVVLCNIRKTLNPLYYKQIIVNCKPLIVSIDSMNAMY